MRRSSFIVFAALTLVAGSLVGCGSYYRVTDPTTGKVYYTEKVERRSGGGVTIRDASSGNEVSLQNSEVQTINKETFESGKAKSGMSPASEAP